MEDAVAPAENLAKLRFARLRALRAWVRGLPGGRLIWRVVVTVIGVAVLAFGILLVPLPGPGWLIIFGGLGILASEYAWARRLLAWVRHMFIRWRQWLGRQPLLIRVFVGLVSLAVIAVLVLAALFIL